MTNLSQICLTATVIDPAAMTITPYGELHELECTTKRDTSMGDLLPYYDDKRHLFVFWESGLIAHYLSNKSAQQLKPCEIEALYRKARHYAPIDIARSEALA